MRFSRASRFNRFNKLSILISGLLLSLPVLGIAATKINIKGLESYPKLQEYLETMVVTNYQETRVNTYALKQDTLKALQAKGYYDATVNLSNHHEKYTLLIEPLNIYHISDIQIQGYDYKQSLNIKTGDVIIAEEVLAQQKDILSSIKSHNCFYQLSVQNEIYLDHDKQLAEIIFRVTAGRDAKFGQTKFTELKTINPGYIKSLITYKENTCWDADKVEETKTALMNTGLFSYIKTNLPETPNTNGMVDINFDFEERPPRSVRLGVNYTSDEGPGFISKWSHRNILGSAEELAFDLKTSLIIQSLKTDFFKPQIFGTKQSLSVGSLLEHKDTDAYEELKLNFNTKYIHKHSKTLTASLGTTAGISEITAVDTDKKKKEKQTFGLISFPGVLTFDDRDDKLDSHNGIFSQSTVEPFGDLLGSSAPFLRLNQTNSFYFDLSNYLLLDPILAFRTNLGGIFGHNTADIPASNRYYAGGGNSVRGVQLQYAGPIKDGDPTGGRSLVELSSELRLKVTSSIGVVGFVDAGNVYETSLPDFKKGFFLGTGAGLRYFTGFGPIRLDLAIPVNKLKKQKEHFQFYISIGQAF